MTDTQRRAAVVSRHPATLRTLVQGLGAADLSMRQAIGPAFLPRSAPGEFSLVVLDLDVDPDSAPESLVQAVSLTCPQTPVIVTAGVNARARLVQSLASSVVCGLVPKQVHENGPVSTGPDEQDLTVAARRRLTPSQIPEGPAPYLLLGTPIHEHLVASSDEKEAALAACLALGEKLGLSDEKLRRIEVVTDELLLNAIVHAPRDDQGGSRFANTDRRAPVHLGALEQVRLRFASDGRAFAISVADRAGALTRATVAAHVARVLELGGPRPRGGIGGAGLGLVLSFTTSNQLIVHTSPGRFTEMTAVLHVSGSNRVAALRGSALHLFL
jgi:hypothetical protein